jgi:cytochrome c-type biogenesis protein CcmH/NrfG
MIFYLLIIISLITTIILFSFRGTLPVELENKNKKLKFLVLILVSLIATTLYINLSNYWIGSSTLEKIQTLTNIENRQANEIAIVRELMLNLENELKDSPTKSIEKIIELAEAKFFLGYLEESLALYKQARELYPDSINIMKAEAQVRVFLENGSFSKETFKLLRNILSIEQQNILALYIIGNYEYEKKNFSEAYKMFQVLKGLLNEGTQEYNEIRNKILEMEK